VSARKARERFLQDVTESFMSKFGEHFLQSSSGPLTWGV
jgi:hypothetical protein